MPSRTCLASVVLACLLGIFSACAEGPIAAPNEVIEASPGPAIPPEPAVKDDGAPRTSRRSPELSRLTARSIKPRQPGRWS